MSTSKYCCNQTKKARKTRLRSFERSFKKLSFAYVFFSFWSKQAFKTTVWSHFLWKNFHDFLTHKPCWFNWMLCLNGLSYKNELSPIWKIFSKGFGTSYDFLHLKTFFVPILYKPFANIIFYFPSVTLNKLKLLNYKLQLSWVNFWVVKPWGNFFKAIDILNGHTLFLWWSRRW